MFAGEVNIDICFGSESENLVIASPTEGKKSSETSVWPDSLPVSPTGSHLLNLQRACPILPYPVQPIARAVSGRENGSPAEARLLSEQKNVSHHPEQASC